MKYLLWIDEKAEGPYEKAAIVKMLLSGKIAKDTLLLLEDGSGEWQAAGTTPGFLDGICPRSRRRKKRACIGLLIVVSVALGSVAIHRAALIRHSRTEPATIQISSELRQELVELQVALERGLTQSEMRERSHAITTQLRLHSAGITPDFKALEISLGALEHFWNRCLDNPNCVLTNEMDLYWLAETGLERNTNVWMAFDFDGSIAAFKARLSGIADTREEVFHGAGFHGEAITESLNQLRVEDSRKVEAFIKNQSAHFDEILDAAIARHDSVDPMYLVKLLKERAYHQSDKLLGK